MNFVPIWKGSLDSAPKNPAPGWAYYDTKLGQSFIFDGTSWQLMSENGKDGKDGENGTNGTIGQNGENGNDGTIIVWKDALETAPENPVKGWCYYNSTEKKSYMYDGTKWQMIAQDGQNGTLIVWQGALETAPENPVTGWCYYNSTEKKSFMYDGTAWQMIAKDGKDYEPPKVFEFSVSAEKKVAFSSGNLLKNNNSNEYKFAANQWTLTEDGYTNTFTYNDIDNWNNKTIDGNQWYALSDAEWKYLIDNHTKQWKTVNNVNGLVILPDESTASISDDWATLEAAGAVFLPCGTKTYGAYWSSSPYGSDCAWCLYFTSGGYVTVLNNYYRYNGLAVRLVRSLQ